jgi:sorting nexin-29
MLAGSLMPLAKEISEYTRKLNLVGVQEDSHSSKQSYRLCKKNSGRIVPIHKKGDEIDCSNYRGISLLSISYKTLSNILLSRLSPYIDEIIGDHQYGFRRNRSTTDQIFCISQMLEKKWEYNGTVYQLFVDFKKAYDSVRRKVLYNILIEFGVPMKLVRLINICLNEMYSSVHIVKYLSDNFPIQNGLKHGDALSSLLFNCVLEYAIRKVQETRRDQN